MEASAPEQIEIDTAVRGAWALADGVIPFIDGEPLAERKALELFRFVTGERFMSASEWDARIEREADPAVRVEMARQRDHNRDRVRSFTRAFIATMLRVFGPIPGVELRTPDGTPVDVESASFQSVAQTLRGGNPSGFDGAIPTLR